MVLTVLAVYWSLFAGYAFPGVFALLGQGEQAPQRPHNPADHIQPVLWTSECSGGHAQATGQIAYHSLQQATYAGQKQPNARQPTHKVGLCDSSLSPPWQWEYRLHRLHRCCGCCSCCNGVPLSVGGNFTKQVASRCHKLQLCAFQSPPGMQHQCICRQQ